MYTIYQVSGKTFFKFTAILELEKMQNFERDYSRNILFDALPEDEQTPEESIYTIGDSLLHQFVCGNWSSSVKEMKEKNISCAELIEYLEHLESELGDCEYFLHFDRSFFGSLGDEKGLRIQ